MDHAIDVLKNYAEASAIELKEEYETGEYENIQKCPSYGEIKVYADAINIMIEYYAPEWERQTPEKLAGLHNYLEED